MINFMKKEVTKNTRTLVVSAIRKIWRTFPPRQKAIEIACINTKEKRHNRKYKCSVCEKSFLLQQVEVNHKNSAKKDESVDDFYKRILLGVKSWKGDIFKLFSGEEKTAIQLAKENLEVVCKECHKIITKEQRKKLTSKNKKVKL